MIKNMLKDHAVIFRAATLLLLLAVSQPLRALGLGDIGILDEMTVELVKSEEPFLVACIHRLGILKVKTTSILVLQIEKLPSCLQCLIDSVEGFSRNG